MDVSLISINHVQLLIMVQHIHPLNSTSWLAKQDTLMIMLDYKKY